MKVFLLALVAAFVAFFVVNAASWLLLGGTMGPLALLVAVVALVWTLKAGYAEPPQERFPPGFVPAFEHDNIAIDVGNGRLWLREKGGASAVIDKGDILRWNMAYVTQGLVRSNNRIEIHVRDLQRPMFSIPFERHRKAAENYKEAEEWQSRLTTWINNS